LGWIEVVPLDLPNHPEDDPVADGLAIELGCDLFEKRRSVGGRNGRRGAQERVDLFVGEGEWC
jgi:hypothetical protein